MPMLSFMHLIYTVANKNRTKKKNAGITFKKALVICLFLQSQILLIGFRIEAEKSG